MRKSILFPLILAIILSISVGVSAASVDDGVITVVERRNDKFFGTKIGAYAVKYVSAKGLDEVFYDLTDDKTMDICDLVKQSICDYDINGDGAYSSKDDEALRILILKEISKEEK